MNSKVFWTAGPAGSPKTKNNLWRLTMIKYETKIINLNNGNSFEYVNYNGAWFRSGKNIQNEGWIYKENEKLWCVLSSLVNSGRRVRIWYGDTETGRSWNDEHEVTGTIGVSTGEISIPLLIKTLRSHGGSSLLIDCIIRIDDIKDKRTLYKHDSFHVEKLEVKTEVGLEYSYRVMQYKDSGEVHNVANFKDNKRALRWIDFMTGDRYRK